MSLKTTTFAINVIIIVMFWTKCHFYDIWYQMSIFLWHLTSNVTVLWYFILKCSKIPYFTTFVSNITKLMLSYIHFLVVHIPVTIKESTSHYLVYFFNYVFCLLFKKSNMIIDACVTRWFTMSLIKNIYSYYLFKWHSNLYLIMCNTTELLNFKVVIRKG